MMLMSLHVNFKSHFKQLLSSFLQGTVCCDVCHLKKYALNPARSSLTTVANQLASIDYAVDRMHFKGHRETPWFEAPTLLHVACK